MLIFSRLRYGDVNHPSIIHLQTRLLSTHPPINPFTRTFIHLSTYPLTHPSIHSPIHAQSSIYHPAIHQSSSHHILTHLPIYPSIHPSIDPSSPNHLFILLPIHLCIHPTIHLPILLPIHPTSICSSTTYPLTIHLLNP